ncbi:MAG: DUF1552 domain-containing protein, partial [Planctomycetales bacterium]|nr:DUF1552 domain-containing protein [Planctomycetales bacterium]
GCRRPRRVGKFGCRRTARFREIQLSPATKINVAIHVASLVGLSDFAQGDLTSDTATFERQVNARDLKRNLGQQDQARLDEYLASITDLENKIANDRLWAEQASRAVPPEINLEIDSSDVENYIRTIYDLMFLAFRADITRVATYQIASEGGTAPTNNLSKRIGIKKDLHKLSHSAGKTPEGFKDWGLWDQFIARQLAYFIGRLKETREGDGSLLDRCLIFQGAATSRVHNNSNYPLILAGGRSVGHQAGQFIAYDEQKNALSNLFVRIANAMDVPIETFGDSNGILMSELFV